MASRDIVLRSQVRAADAAAVRSIVKSTGFFSEAEIGIAVELVQECLARGPASGYCFLFAESAGEVVGYACYGEIPCTIGSYDLYWVAVMNEMRGQGIGRRLVEAVEAEVSQLGGRAIYLDTAGRDAYEPTRNFYERCGYSVAARLEDFYSPGDAKVIYTKALV